MYGNYLDDAAKIVAEKREENLKFEHARLTAEEKEILRLKKELRDTQDALEILKKAISILGE